MKNVLVIYHYFPHYRLPILKALSNQNNNNIEYTFISGSTTDISIKLVDEKEMLLNNIKWEHIENKWFIKKKFLWQKGILKLSYSSEYDTIIYLASPYFISTWLGAILAKIKGKDVLFWTHGFLHTSSLKDKIKKVFFTLSDKMLLYGNKAKDSLITKGFSEKNLHVIYNSLDYEKQVSIRQQISKNELVIKRNKLFKYSKYPILLFIGRLTKQKKLENLLFVVKELHKKGNHVNVLFIGYGEEKSNLMNITKDYKLSEYVCFYGASHNEYELAPLIFLSDLCISPGEVGLTAMHSLVYGTPVITHDNYKYQMPEYEAIIPNQTGLLYKYNSNISLIETIITWLNKEEDRDKIRQKCYSIIENFYTPNQQVKFINNAILGINNEK